MIYLNDDIAHFSFEEALPLLSRQRREQALKFRHEQGRRTCAAAYLLLCEGLRREYGIDEPPVFVYGEHGKPAIAGHPEIHFNMSHCRQAAICALSRQPVGIDIENIREYRQSLVNFTMNVDEQKIISSDPMPSVAFTRLWTQKEAVLKLSGQGLVSDMPTVLDACRAQVSMHQQMPPSQRPFITTIVNMEHEIVYSIATYKYINEHDVVKINQ